jgi:glutathione synthase/RimK-type ligase-like ATP-grasp enzyme
MTLKLFPYKPASQSAIRLSRKLGILRVSPNYNAKRSDVIVNWGASTPPHFKSMDHDLNKHDAIAIACDKLKTFQTLERQGFEQIPQFTTSKDIAKHLIDIGDTIYCRTKLHSHSGNGIIICDDANNLPDAPLYTVKAKHKHEYRVHIFKGDVLYVQQKKKVIGSSIVSNGIRNRGNDWVYCQPTDQPSELLLLSCIRAVSILGLDFGAVDVGHRIRDNRFFIFEINTAPGLVGTTLDKYTKAIYNYYRSL